MEWTFVKDTGQMTVFWEKKQLGPVILHPVAVGSGFHPSGSKLGTVGVSGCQGQNRHTVNARGGLERGCCGVHVGGGVNTHARYTHSLS